MALAMDTGPRGVGRGLRPRLLVLVWLVSLVFVLLAWRLYTLQVLRGEELTTKGRRNFVQRVRVPHDRGIIFDRHGRILVDNRPSLDVQIIPAFLGSSNDAERSLTELSAIVGLTPDELGAVRTSVKARRGLGLFQPFLVKRDLDAEQVEAIEAERSLFRLDGVDIIEGRRRTFPHGSLAAHLLGYVNEIDARALERERARGNPESYEIGDIVGRDGIERTYELALRGHDGFEKIVVDAKGRRMQGEYVNLLLGEHRWQEPTPGHNLFLTLDLDLQQTAEDAFDGQAGAVVALDPHNGEILALASVPAFDANLVSGVLAAAAKERLDADPLKPWVNRAIAGQYAPGSTFKVVTALAALTERAAGPHERVLCPGSFKMGRHTWRCHRDAGHGQVDLRTALKVSCDTYFYTMAARLGIEPIATMGHLLGLGQPSGIALRGEQPGLMPDTRFHDRVDQATGGYQRGMAVNTAIGQGAVLVTPLQLALLYAAIANGGTVYQPQLVHRVETADFRVTQRSVPQPQSVPNMPFAINETVVGVEPSITTRATPRASSALGVRAAYLRAVQEGLEAVTGEPGGTAYWRRSRKVPMAGKTGTSQVVRLGKNRLKTEAMGFFERDHAWFVGYAPLSNPQIVVAVLNEHAGHGGSQAAPIAVRVIDAFFALSQQRAARAAIGEVNGE